MQGSFRWVVALGLAIAAGLPGQTDEYQVKAFFLYNFTRYVEWPAGKFRSASDPIVICVLGQDPFGGALVQAANGKVVEGRSVQVHPIAEVGPKCDCHILFVGASERKRFRPAYAAIKGSGILTVGEAQGFTSEGGIISFKLEDGKVRFEINIEAAQQEHLHISSKLLSLAQGYREAITSWLVKSCAVPMQVFPGNAPQSPLPHTLRQ